MLENMFSNTILRILFARKNNPPGFKNMTVFLDGHDSRIDYLKKDIQKKDFYSYKFKHSGLRTQIIYDINNLAIYVSDSKPCKSYNDGQMFLDMKMEKKLNENDCICFDGGYYYYIEKFIENCIKYGNEHINKNNFMYPIRKQANIDLTETEKIYNDTLGSFRSSIEHNFGIFGNTFLRFNNNERTTKVTNLRVYNLQIKMSLLLLSIEKFCKLYNISIQPHHMLWMNHNFDFPDPNKRNQHDIIESFDLERINYMTNKQNELISNYFSLHENNLVIPDNDIEIDDEDNHYEIEYIIKHRKYKRRTKFLVKWKGYDNSHNSWVWQEDFDDNDIIDKYLENLENL